MRRGSAVLRPYRRTRNAAYKVARGMGNWQPWLELLTGDPRGPGKIVRRQVNRALGRMGGRALFGDGLVSRIIKSILGA